MSCWVGTRDLVLLLLDSDFAIRSGTGTNRWTNRKNHDVRICAVCIGNGIARQTRVGQICSAQAIAVDVGHDAGRPANVPSQLTLPIKQKHWTGKQEEELVLGS